jgi:hypothetical protein
MQISAMLAFWRLEFARVATAESRHGGNDGTESGLEKTKRKNTPWPALIGSPAEVQDDPFMPCACLGT